MSRHLLWLVAGLAGGWVALVPPAAKAEEGFVSLFNGRDLEGWVIQDGPDGCFRARDGRLECTGAYGFPAWLRSERTYENFTLRFEFRLGYYAESGLLIHAPLHGRKSRVGIGVKLCDDEAPGARAQHCGTIIGVSPPRHVATHHFDEWNQVEVHVDYPQLRVILNGKVVQDLDCQQNEKLRYRLRHGYIGLQNMGKRTQFRNLRIKELPSKVTWMPLFDGKTFDGWRRIGGASWEINDGVLKTANGNGYLVTDEQYEDFVLFTYVRTSRHANGGIFYRWKTLRPSDRGYEIQIENIPDSNNPTGSIYTIDRADVLTVRDGEWFPMQIFVKGRTTVVRVNGETCARSDSLTLVRAGHIALQMHRRNSSVEFKEIRIRPN